MTVPRFSDLVRASGRPQLRARTIAVLQVNMGRRCNMSCSHCHLACGPDRGEVMDDRTVDTVLQVLADTPVPLLDITGGAPELNPSFRRLVTEAVRLGKKVMARTNLTVFTEPGMEDLPEFYRKHEVELVASLPCYLEENVAAMRGSGTYEKSIAGLRRLNSLGYGRDTAGPSLSLVYNPGGPFLAPDQQLLERDYRRVLGERFGILFSRLFAFVNMPIGRFRDRLAGQGRLDGYQELLAAAFNPAALEQVMCRSLVSVGWDGRLFDCDFNLALDLGVGRDLPRTIGEYDHALLEQRPIVTDSHCYGCVAGQGSS